VARFRLSAHTLPVKTVTWTHNTFPACDLCNAYYYDVQNELYVLFHCTHLHVVSLRRTYASLFPPTGFHNVSAFLSQNKSNLHFLFHALIAFYGQTSCHTF